MKKPSVPETFVAVAVHGLVRTLVVDPVVPFGTAHLAGRAGVVAVAGC